MTRWQVYSFLNICICIIELFSSSAAPQNQFVFFLKNVLNYVLNPFFAIGSWLKKWCISTHTSCFDQALPTKPLCNPECVWTQVSGLVQQCWNNCHVFNGPNLIFTDLGNNNNGDICSSQPRRDRTSVESFRV